MNITTRRNLLLLYNVFMKTELEVREYVIQPNAISQSIYSVSTYARRLIAMAMSLLPLEQKSEKDFKVSFSVSAFVKSLGMETGTKTFRLIRRAVEECAGSLIKIINENKDATEYICYTWFSETNLFLTKLTAGSNLSSITMKFNPKIAQAIGDFKKQYAKINLVDFGKLQGRYSIRLYELALSYSGFAGRDGNKKNEWFFEKSVEDLKILLEIDLQKYKRTGDFRTKIIDNPISEINAAGIGLRIEPEYKREGKFLVKIRFNCRWIARNEPVPVAPCTETEKEEEEILKKYPELFEAALADERKQQDMFPKIGDPEILARAAAFERVRKETQKKPQKRQKVK